mmetsp:Transcript_17399/g.40164  ORF Transcript_17399/g.40164 Transcript_17399/m.40164 type:complete len:391 (-) Transcript_17399:181-1353(-)
MLRHPLELPHRNRQPVLPVVRLHNEVERAHGAPLTGGVEVRELDHDNGLAPCMHVEADLQSDNDDPPNHGLTVVSQGADGLHGDLCEDVGGEALHELMLEYVNAGLVRPVGSRPQPLVRHGGEEAVVVFQVRDHHLLLRGVHGGVARLEVAEGLLDQDLCLIRVDVANHVEVCVVGAVVRGMIRLDLLVGPRLDLLHLADGEALLEPVLLVKRGEELHLHPVVDGVDHGRLGQDGGSLLLHPRRFELGLHHVAEGVERQREHGHPGRGAVRGAGGPVDGVVEVSLGVCLRRCSKETLPFLAAHIGHVLAHVSHSLLRHQLVRRPRTHLQVALEPPRGCCVGQDAVCEPVWQLPKPRPGVLGERDLVDQLREGLSILDLPRLKTLCYRFHR